MIMSFFSLKTPRCLYAVKINFLFSTFSRFPLLSKKNKITGLKTYNFSTTSTSLVQESKVKGVHDNISSLQLKKRLIRKKKLVDNEKKAPGLFNVSAFATAEEYDLEQLVRGLKNQDLYEPKFIENSTDVVVASAKYQLEEEPRDIFFFREGSVVMWNVNDLESSNLLSFLRQYENDSYSNQLIEGENEIMTYKHQEGSKASVIEKNGYFGLNINPDSILLDKYTFSNALALSVKLAVWEVSLEKYIDSIEYVTEDLKMGKRIKMSREQVLRKHGELFALRHLINLSSDLLDTPDFYWDNEQLENLYLQVCSYFGISKRTKVMNEKINHCVELIELLSTHLSNKHSTRLEWIVILLILVEVIFEIIHYLDRFVTSGRNKFSLSHIESTQV
ncbi:required for meiotic nuclear division protein 1 homolog isoform X1 [Harmonia axyridis]|uniref:required for meiotic nuclear division protein 1 homolog isoform X1 n=2 Tax=Harmonia axyridis TaxID=115357 RepID=UPI001E27615E|nr:required for meiotic nuclear division protein 1 homolog isoform X1 [Harmonia axyridis]